MAAMEARDPDPAVEAEGASPVPATREERARRIAERRAAAAAASQARVEMKAEDPAAADSNGPPAATAEPKGARGEANGLRGPGEPRAGELRAEVERLKEMQEKAARTRRQVVLFPSDKLA
jgi:hypothetical protein